MEKTPNDDVFPRLHAESDDVLYPNGNFEINERFVAFGGEPAELDNAASIASATLVVAEQLYEMDATLSCAAAHLGDIATELKRLRQVASKRK